MAASIVEGWGGYTDELVGQRSDVMNGAASVAGAGQSVSAVILTWNSVGKIEPCLQSLGMGTKVPDEIIVVDNGSTDQTCTTLARQFPSVRVIANTHNRGVARGRNQGLMSASGRYLLVLDDDTVIQPESLSRLISILAMQSTVGLCGSQLLDPVRRLIPVNLKFPTFWHKANQWRKTGRQNGEGMLDRAREVDYIVGACQLIRREVLDEIGGYDERIFYGPEDIDFCLRLRQAGWRVVCEPAAQVVHAEQRIARSLLSAIGRHHALGLAYYFWKNRYGLSRKRLYTRLPTYLSASRSH